MFYNLKRAGRALRKMGAIDFATTIAPGVRDVLLTGKIKEAVTRRHDGQRVYDAVVVDAPPTGRITRFLGVTGGDEPAGPLRPDQDAERRRHGRAALAADRRPPGHPARGHAGPGDGGRHRRADEAHLPVGVGDREHGGRAAAAAGEPRPRGRGPAHRRRPRAGPGRRPHRRPGARRRAGRARPSSTRRPGPRRTRCAAGSRRWAGRPSSCPCWSGRSTSARCSSSPAGSRSTCSTVGVAA